MLSENTNPVFSNAFETALLVSFTVMALRILYLIFRFNRADRERRDLENLSGNVDMDLFKIKIDSLLRIKKYLSGYEDLSPEYQPFLEDLKKLQFAIFYKKDKFFTLEQCGNIWQNRSESVQASWLDMPRDISQIVRDVVKADGFKSFEDWANIKISKPNRHDS